MKCYHKFLILGTIHPFKQNTHCGFFYRNTNIFWNILDEIFEENLNSPENIEVFLEKHSIAISDMILECKIEHENITADKDLQALKLNENLKNQILESNIDTIFFTSAFGTNNATKLFFHAFKLKKPKNWQENNREFSIDFYGKTITCIILFSPSNRALPGIVNNKSFQSNRIRCPQLSTNTFRKNFYKEKFQKFFELPSN